DVSGTVGVSGSVAVSGPVDVSGTVGVSGSVAVSGPVDVSGTVAVSGSVFVENSGGNPLYVNLYSRNTLDSGPVSGGPMNGDTHSGLTVWDVLGYNSWTLAVKWSGYTGSGAQWHTKLQVAAVSGDANFIDDDGTKNFSGTSWNFFTPNYHVRYARIYVSGNAAASGTLYQYLQAEY
ncbi:MAG: hypothetical protein U9N81_09695, partial [Bacillota bacterium]|nr:hypothetical protein [Bacillota bacterium]